MTTVTHSVEIVLSREKFKRILSYQLFKKMLNFGGDWFIFNTAAFLTNEVNMVVFDKFIFGFGIGDGNFDYQTQFFHC